jgi:exonuclease III
VPRVLELLAEHRPDLLCLQETRVAADEDLREAAHHSAGRTEARWVEPTARRRR